jgi:hypothetical protein
LLTEAVAGAVVDLVEVADALALGFSVVVFLADLVEVADLLALAAFLLSCLAFLTAAFFLRLASLLAYLASRLAVLVVALVVASASFLVYLLMKVWHALHRISSSELSQILSQGCTSVCSMA